MAMKWTDTPPTRSDVGKFFWYQIMPREIDGDIAYMDPDIGEVVYASGYLWMHGRYPRSFNPINKPNQGISMRFAGPIEMPE